MTAVWLRRLRRGLFVVFCGGLLAVFAFGLVTHRTFICGIEFEPHEMAERIQSLKSGP